MENGEFDARRGGRFGVESRGIIVDAVIEKQRFYKLRHRGVAGDLPKVYTEKAYKSVDYRDRAHNDAVFGGSGIDIRVAGVEVLDHFHNDGDDLFFGFVAEFLLGDAAFLAAEPARLTEGKVVDEFTEGAYEEPELMHGIGTYRNAVGEIGERLFVGAHRAYHVFHGAEEAFAAIFGEGFSFEVVARKGCQCDGFHLDGAVLEKFRFTELRREAAERGS